MRFTRMPLNLTLKRMFLRNSEGIKSQTMKVVHHWPSSLSLVEGIVQIDHLNLSLKQHINGSKVNLLSLRDESTDFSFNRDEGIV